MSDEPNNQLPDSDRLRERQSLTPSIDWKPEKGKCFCRQCDARIRGDQIKTIPTPKGHEWSYCENCDSTDCFGTICDYPGCNDEGVCGVPTTTEYVCVCSKHYRMLAARPAATSEKE